MKTERTAAVKAAASLGGINFAKLAEMQLAGKFVGVWADSDGSGNATIGLNAQGTTEGLAACVSRLQAQGFKVRRISTFGGGQFSVK